MKLRPEAIDAMAETMRWLANDDENTAPESVGKISADLLEYAKMLARPYHNVNPILIPARIALLATAYADAYGLTLPALNPGLQEDPHRA